MSGWADLLEEEGVGLVRDPGTSPAGCERTILGPDSVSLPRGRNREYSVPSSPILMFPSRLDISFPLVSVKPGVPRYSHRRYGSVNWAVG